MHANDDAKRADEAIREARSAAKADLELVIERLKRAGLHPSGIALAAYDAAASLQLAAMQEKHRECCPQVMLVTEKDVPLLAEGLAFSLSANVQHNANRRADELDRKERVRKAGLN
jgi:hypothetical protein